MGRMLGMLTLFLCCLLLSGFFSGSETALLSASRLRMQRLAHEGDRPAALVLELTANPRHLLAGILVGNNIVNVLAAATATIFFTDRLGTATGVVVATVVSTTRRCSWSVRVGASPVVPHGTTPVMPAAAW